MSLGEKLKDLKNKQQGKEVLEEKRREEEKKKSLLLTGEEEKRRKSILESLRKTAESEYLPILDIINESFCGNKGEISLSKIEEELKIITEKNIKDEDIFFSVSLTWNCERRGNKLISYNRLWISFSNFNFSLGGRESKIFYSTDRNDKNLKRNLENKIYFLLSEEKNYHWPVYSSGENWNIWYGMGY